MSDANVYIAGNHHDYLCNTLVNILNNLQKLTSHYVTLLTYHHANDKALYKEQNKLIERYYLHLERTESNYLSWVKDVQTLNKYENELVQQIEKQIANTGEISMAIRTHIDSINKPTVKRAKYLGIGDVLSILDVIHPDYSFVRNDIREIQMKDSQYFIYNRITFVDKKYEFYYVDYITNTPVEDVAGRNMLNQEVSNGIYDTMKYKVEKH